MRRQTSWLRRGVCHARERDQLHRRWLQLRLGRRDELIVTGVGSLAVETVEMPALFVAYTLFVACKSDTIYRHKTRVISIEFLFSDGYVFPLFSEVLCTSHCYRVSPLQLTTSGPRGGYGENSANHSSSGVHDASFAYTTKKTMTIRLPDLQTAFRRRSLVIRASVPFTNDSSPSFDAGYLAWFFYHVVVY